MLLLSALHAKMKDYFGGVDKHPFGEYLCDRNTPLPGGRIFEEEWGHADTSTEDDASGNIKFERMAYG